MTRRDVVIIIIRLYQFPLFAPKSRRRPDPRFLVCWCINSLSTATKSGLATGERAKTT